MLVWASAERLSGGGGRRVDLRIRCKLDLRRARAGSVSVRQGQSRATSAEPPPCAPSRLANAAGVYKTENACSDTL